MALLQSFRGSIFKTETNVLKLCSTFVQKPDPSEQLLKEIQDLRKKEDMPVEITNPFVAEKPKCILCKYEIEPNFKNVRLLSQFVSTITGKIYGRYITGLCEYKQKRVEMEIKKAQSAGLMGYCVKDPNFLADPDLYDPSKPFKFL